MLKNTSCLFISTYRCFNRENLWNGKLSDKADVWKFVLFWDWSILNKTSRAWNKSISKDLADQLFLKTLPLMIKFRQLGMGHHYGNGLDFSVSKQIFFHGWFWILLSIVHSKTWTRPFFHENHSSLWSKYFLCILLSVYISGHLRPIFLENNSSLWSTYFLCILVAVYISSHLKCTPEYKTNFSWK